MDGANRKRLLILLACSTAIGAAGCADLGDMPYWTPGQKPPEDEFSGIVSPHQRIETLRELSAKADRADAEAKRRVAAELSVAIQAEEDPLIRAEIVRTLGAYPGTQTDAVLRAALHDPEADVRMAACEAWGKHGDAEAATVLGGVLRGDVDKDVRLAAARALGRTKDPAAVAALGEVLEDKDPAMQVRAVKSLRKITGQNFGNDVNRWQQYVQGQTPQPATPTSIAERLGQLF